MLEPGYTPCMNLSPKTLEALKWIITILKERSIPYQISGGFAAKLYGSPRDLNDIDIDVPDAALSGLVDVVRPYIIDELTHYQDGKWDLNIMTLNYGGQEIDIGGADEVKVSNQERTVFIPIPSDLANAQKVEVAGLVVNVMPPEDLIAYKQHLDGEHQIIDIEAVKKYILSRS
jgi:predicted nucleotidyltransferase